MTCVRLSLTADKTGELTVKFSGLQREVLVIDSTRGQALNRKSFKLGNLFKVLMVIQLQHKQVRTCEVIEGNTYSPGDTALAESKRSKARESA